MQAWPGSPSFSSGPITFAAGNASPEALDFEHRFGEQGFLALAPSLFAKDVIGSQSVDALKLHGSGLTLGAEETVRQGDHGRALRDMSGDQVEIVLKACLVIAGRGAMIAQSIHFSFLCT
jgi:hypothetical protein